MDMSESNGVNSMVNQELLKEQAALAAVDFVSPGMVLGLGSGSTVLFALKEIGRRIRSGSLIDVAGIPSSLETEALAVQFGIPLTTFGKISEIDLTIDGADEVDPNLDLIKGGGAALLREKVLAQASRRNVIIVDQSKLSERLGTLWPVPVEVLPFAWEAEARFMESLGAQPQLRMGQDGEAITTNQGNYIIDADFGPISDPHSLASSLKQRAGVLEHGLFLNFPKDLIVASASGIAISNNDDYLKTIQV